MASSLKDSIRQALKKESGCIHSAGMAATGNSHTRLMTISAMSFSITWAEACVYSKDLGASAFNLPKRTQLLERM